MTLTYTKDMDIRNVANLPRGTGCKFLLCILGPTDKTFIAKQWCRKMPKTIGVIETVVKF